MPPLDLRQHKIAGHARELLKTALSEAKGRGVAMEPGKVHHEVGYKLGEPSYVIPASP